MDPEQSTTEPTVTVLDTPKSAKVITEKQREALAAARAKAVQVRKENAALREKERVVQKAKSLAEREERAARVSREFEALTTKKPSPEPSTSDEAAYESPPPPKKRKPTKRIITVQEATSDEDEEEEQIEVRLPRERKPPSADQLRYEKSMNKMFTYGY